MISRGLAGGLAAVLFVAAGAAWLYENSLGADLREGEAAVAAGRPDLAEAAFRRALTREPHNERAMYGIGWAWHMAEQEDQAREAFRLLQEVHPESPLGYKGMGSVWMQEGNVKEARVSFERALDVAKAAPPSSSGCGGADDNVDPMRIENSLAALELTQRDGAAALARYDALVASHPGRAELQQGRAEALLLLGRDDEALQTASLAVDLAKAQSDGAGERVQATALLTRARALLVVSGGRVDKTRCTETALPVYAVLESADRDLDQAESLGMAIPSLLGLRRTIIDRRARVDDDCPGVRALAAPPRAGN